MKFTGHERDMGSNLLSVQDDLDYMHARHYNMMVGRFLQPDPILGGPTAPQSWNRYAYVQGNPINFIDPYGLQQAQYTFNGEITVIGGAIGEVIPMDLDFPPPPGSYWDSWGFEGRNSGGINSMPALPPEMLGRSFRENLGLAQILNGGAPCADYSCGMLGIVGSGLEDPILQTIMGAQKAGMAIVFPSFLSGGTGGVATSEFRGFLYSPKVMQQMSKLDDIYHGFPGSFDRVILETGRVTIHPGGYTVWSVEGAVNGRVGWYEIGAKPLESGWEVVHRLFEAIKFK